MNKMNLNKKQNNSSPRIVGEQNTQPKISVVMSCYNEQKNLERGVLQEVHDYLKKQKYTWEVVIVDDESTDNSKKLLEDYVKTKKRFRLFSIPHGGKPAGIWAGIQKSKGKILLFTDIDQSTPLSELDKLLPWYKKGYDAVIGSRGLNRKGFPLLRRIGSVVFRFIRGTFLLKEINDTQCGFKSCKRDLALKIFPKLQFFQQKEKTVGWKVSAYDVELLHLMNRAGYKIKEVNVRWTNEDESDTKTQTSEIQKYIKESIDMFKEIIRVKRNEARGLYDKT